MKIVRENLLNWIELPQFSESSRGQLSTLEFDQLPFVPSRIFYINNVPAGEVRGGHAHKYGTQLLICLAGRIKIELEYQNIHQTVVLEPNGSGVLLKPNIWAQQSYLDENSCLLAICSHPYDPDSLMNHYGLPDE